MEIRTLSKQIHKNAVMKGFWDKEKNFGEELMLVVSELGECIEAHRVGKKALIGKHNMNLAMDSENFVKSFEENIKDSIEDELADAVIRILDLAEGMKIDINYHIKEKMKYNTTRGKLHGKKY